VFGKIAAFEVRYQLRQPVFWVVFGLFFLFIFGSVTLDQIQIGSGGNVHKNSPFAIVQTHVIGAIFFMFVTTAFVANVIVRDDETGYGPIVRATRVRKFDYLFGRFTGAFAVVAMAYLSVPLAMMLGAGVGGALGWVDAELLGPFRLADYAYGYFVMGLPGVFLTAAIFFALATVTRSMMATYLGVVAFLVAYLVSSVFLSKPEYEDTAALWEPFGAAAYGLVTEYWTATERNSVNAPLEGPLLYNRLIWMGVAAAFLALAYVLFRFDTKAAKLKKKQKLQKLVEAELPAGTLGGLATPRFDARTAWAQLVVRTRLEMGQVFKSPAFVVLLALGSANSGGGLWFANELYGTQIFPVTRVMIETLNGAFTIFPLIIAVYYGGELVWRERDRRMHEIIDSTAVPDWAFVVPKTLAITLVLIATLLVSVLTAVAVQAFKGYFNFEFGKYLGWYVLPMSVDLFLIAALSVFLQAVSPHKFVGWGLMVIYVVSTLVLGNLGLEHNLYRYGGNPPVPLSDMNGQGDFAVAAAWFRAYWTAFALLLLVLAYGLWRRGTETRFAPRLARLPSKLRGPAGLLAAVSLTAFACLGAWIFVNTNVWNEYRTQRGDERWLAAYEKALLQYENTPQPSVAQVALDVSLYPHDSRLTARGTYVLENRTDQPLRQVHVRYDRDTRLVSLDVPGTRPVRTYPRFHYRILAFDTPMIPGERRTMRFVSARGQRGFKNSGNTTRIVDNGTFVNNFEVAPVIGMTRDQLLRDRADRRRHGLPAELRPAKLEDVSARRFNYARADWVDTDITVSTVAGQTPVAPGYKVSDVTHGGRRTARFRSDAPILHFYSIQSARYEQKTQAHQGVNLSVFYDRQHRANVDRMISALRASLDYYQAAFGPYQFRQARIIEFPAYAQFAQAFANTMPYSEGLGFITNVTDPEKIDYVTYVTAHELGHQWWAHQLIGADAQGATALSETLAQYSALMVMERLYGPDQIRKFLKYELDNYLRNRGGEVLEELPLYRVENQPYIHYRKGSLVMYLLKDQIGEEAVNRALRSLLRTYAFKGAPYPTSIELVRALRAEAGPQHQELITDLFERITLYDVKVTAAQARRLPDGRWDVTVSVDARKLYADGQGRETPAPMNASFDVGLFTAEPGKKNFDRSDVLLFERRPLRSGRQTYRFTVDRKPTHAGVDPYNKRIDRNADDNVKAVTAG
jgi:ABC-2 type transport system permease protein